MTERPGITYLSVVVPQGQPRHVKYYSVIEQKLLITNMATVHIVLDRVLLRFQSDSELGSIRVELPCSAVLKPDQSIEEVVKIRPTAMFLANTNSFQIQVWFRRASDQGYEAPVSEVHCPPACLIISDPTPDLGQLFISFKQPEDLELMNTLDRVARRAGFTPWTAYRRTPVGAAPWLGIERAIRDSVAVAFIWTPNTDFTDGVRKEVALCRRYGVREEPLLEVGIPVPEPFRDGKVQYKQFARETPTEAFVKVVDELRDKAQRKRQGM
jgi:hypothetical protein